MRAVMKIVLIGLLVVFGQCGTRDEPTALPEVAGLVGTWQLVEPASSYPVTLQLALDTANPPRDVTAFKATGRSAVNTYNAFLSAAVDGLMVVVQLSSTKVGGPAEAMQFEQTYFTNLRAVVRYKLLTPNRLQLSYGGAQPGVLTYDRLP